MTQDLLLDASRAFFGQVTKLDARYARLTLMQANTRYRLATVSVRYGVREFRVEIDRYRNTIRLSEITVHRRLGFDHRNPLNGFAMQEIEHVRLLHTHRLDRYLPVESDLDKKR